MKKILWKLRAIAPGAVAFLFCVLLIACKKGDAGPAGAAGAQGKPGNANVKSTVVTVSNWTVDAPDYKADISVPAITQDIINTGAVLVYLESNGNYVQLPFTYYLTGYSESLVFETMVGGVRVYITDSDQSQPTAPAALKFKVVVLSSDGLVRGGFKNYAALKAVYNIAD